MKNYFKLFLFLILVVCISAFCLSFAHAESTPLKAVDDSNFDIYAITEYIDVEVHKNKYFENDYGGKYIDQQGNLVILVPKKAQRNIVNTFKLEIPNNAILYSTCDYSLGELNAINEELKALWFNNNLDPKFSVLAESLGMISVREDLNRIVVNLTNSDEEIIDLLKEYVSNFSAIIVGENFEYIPQTETLCPGGKIMVDDISSYPVVRYSISIGFRARYSESSGYTQTGLVTTGHAGGVNSPVIDSLGREIGSIKRSSFGSSTTVLSDSAFAIIYQGVSNNIAYGSKVLLSGSYITNFSVGSTVYMVGFASNETSGTINSVNVSMRLSNTNYVVTDCATATYSSNAGDSGGLVYSSIPSGNSMAGIHMGKVAGGYSIFSKSYNILTSLNVAPY